ncbi:MAG: enoyl-CoA hydratase [Mycobacterium sp.]
MTTLDSSTDAYPTVQGLAVALADGVLSITMNRPESLNSLTETMLYGIADAVERAADDDRVRVVRLGGAGRGFSSGAGISEEDQKSGGAGSPTRIIDEANRAVRALATLPKPAVAVVHGPAAGVATSLAFGCDVVLASEKAFFMLAFTKIGLMPDGGSSALVAAAVGRIRAMRMALLAERIPAREALDWGLVTAVYPADEFDAQVDDVIAKLVNGPAVAFAKTKEAVNAATLTELERAFEREKQGQSVLIRSHDFIEGTLAFQQRRSPDFTDR